MSATSAEKSGAFPDGLGLEPVSRRPTVLPPATVEAVLGAEVARLPVRAAAGEPRATIIVLTFDGLVFTRLCLESLFANTDEPTYELVVVDNGSTDGTVKYLEALASRFSGVRLVLNDDNLGPGPAVNLGLAAASGEILVLLNNDTILPTGWLARLSRHLADPRIGLVGAVTNRIGTEAEVETTYRTYGEFLEFARRRAVECAGETRPIRLPAMFCVAFRRDLYEEIGPVDEGYELFYFEDEDYAMSARAAGYTTACADDVFVHHFGETSSGPLFADGTLGRALERNRRRFEEKWGQPWRPMRRPPSSHYITVRDRIHTAAAGALPSGATVAVVSRGDDLLIEFDDAVGWHFPRMGNGAWAGAYPADGTEAIAQLESVRSDGAMFLLLPETGFWWLDHYDELRRHLDTRYQVVLRDDSCVLFDLRS